ncbi:MAG: ABC transporter permease [Roseomonas sp.]|nr:ABC transporter permease [Roseomonas sp.]
MARASNFLDLWNSRGLVFPLARAQLRDRHSGSALGVLWALLQPAVLMAVFWFVFSFGLKVVSPPDEAPFVALLLVGLAAWFWFNEAVSMGSHAVTGSAYLVKKVSFPVELLPLAPLIASLMVHIALLALLLVGLSMSEHWSGSRLFQLPYYILASATLSCGLVFWLSALHVFHRDVAQITTLVLQIWFWLTPIVWSYADFPPEVSALLSWNPMAYVVEGYRWALLGTVSAPPGLDHAVGFWATALSVLASGIIFFRRLRSDFADVL